MSDEGEKFCQNCRCYGWEQPSVRSDMKHCEQCKKFDYCGEDCEREHWLKVHKKHCEYLAGKKVLAMSEHDEVTCLVCRIGADPTNPKARVLPCTMSTTTMAQTRIVVDTASPGLGLAEMTGKFHSKEEATITQMMRLVIKMSMLEHPATRTRELCGKLYKVLNGARVKCWDAQYCYSDHVIAQSGVVADNFISSTTFSIARLVEDLNQENAIWSMLAILSYFLQAELSSHGRKIVENTDMLPVMSDIMGRVRLSSSRLKDLWDSVLRMFEGGLVPSFPEVMAVMCGGVNHKCCVCEEVVTVARVWVTNDPAPVPVLLLVPGAMHVVMCTKPGCWEQLGRIRDVEVFQLYKLYLEVQVAHSMENCDYCGQNYRGRVGHRCSRCLTKLYCGEECRVQDWGVHRLNCKEGKEDRKKKGGKGVRKQEGAAMVDAWTFILYVEHDL